MSDASLGVFICDCGDRIGGYLDTGALETQVRDMPEVALVRRLRYSCSPDGLAVIREAIDKAGLDRVLIAGCTPRTLEPRFRSACREAGLDGDLVELADIREGCAWVHRDDPQSATVKALDLIRMGIARVVLRQPRRAPSAEIVPAALVIGGGLAGMTAALRLANVGIPVKLVEQEAALGGMLRDVHSLYPDRHSAAEYLAEKVDAVSRHPQIDVLMESRVTDVSGTVGCYTVSVEREAGPQDGGLTFDVGAVIVATGACVLKPYGLFGYDGLRVVTQDEFERELGKSGNGAQPADLPDEVVMILCAGQRDETISYCSGVCCMGALKQALEIKAARPQANVTIVFRDLNLLGEDLHKEEVLKAQRAGVKFVHYSPASPPRITDEVVEVYDESVGMSHRLPYDRVVLATPLVPQPDAGAVAHMLKIGQDENGFFPQIRLRLRPQNTCERGIFVCGSAHYPTGWDEAEFQATSAAFNVLRHLRSGTVSGHSSAAIVDESLCTGCGGCVEVCPFDAISMRRREGVLDCSFIDPLVCKGCGNCVVACPVKAIDLPLESDAQLLTQIEEALATASQNGSPRILVFGCEWSGLAAAELAGASGLGYPVGVRPIRIGCSARFDPLHALWGLFNGADGIFVGACSPGACHYVNGNRYAQDRFNTLREMLAESGFDPRRLRLEWIAPDDPHDFVNKITDFADLLQALSGVG
jgi:heterodisulfide reductase subunit A